MRLIIPVLLNCLMVLGVKLADRYTGFGKLSYKKKQLITGLMFGGVSSFASSYGVEWLGAVVNVRDAAPLSAGLIFGAPAGIIAGFIGGIYRWVSVAWGAGTYTRLACSIATILAGLLAAGIRKLMFDNKKPTWGYGVCITVVCEVIHMILIFLTNMDDSSYAFEFVKGASTPMIIGNSIAVGVSIIIISLLSRERLTRKRNCENIAQTFQRWLLVCIVIAYMVTSLFTFMLQNGIVSIETQEMFSAAINDVKAEVTDKSDRYILDITGKIAEKYEQNNAVSLEELAEEHNVIEIDVVADDGLIINSTEKSRINSFNMNSTEISGEFNVLTRGLSTYVQQYGADGNYGADARKYAGAALKSGGYIRVGYSAEQFHGMLDKLIIDVIRNRHVGTSGFVVICDEDFRLVTHKSENGSHISVIGIEPNEEMLGKKSANSLNEADILDSESGETKKCIYVFTFAEGYCIIAAMPKAEAMFVRDASLYTSVFMQVLIFATLFVFIYILIKRVIISNLQRINNTLGQITDGNLNITVDVRSNEEFASLSDDINSTVATLKQYIAEAAARIDRELEYAKQIQLSALPMNFPDTGEYGICARMIAAREIGGDFYDFYRLNDRELAFLVADVSGKGIPAAMFMMTAKTIIKDLAESGMAVNDIFTKANEKLCESNESGMFVTAWMGILDIFTGKLQFTNAGHNPPLVKRGNGNFEYLKAKAGLVLAGMEGIRYRSSEVYLEPGDRVFLYTDGVTEATDTENRLYGEERLYDFLNTAEALRGQELLTALKENIDEFVGEAPQFDDITMLMLDYRTRREVQT